MESNMSNKILFFQDQPVRNTWHNGELWFVVEDVIAVLTKSRNPKKYLAALRSRDKELAKGYPQIVDTLLVDTEGGRQKMTCSHRAGIFRIIMSVTSSKAEPFKLWLAQVGAEHMQETENPALALDRLRAIYEAKGYSKDWIDLRLKGIGIRKELTDEWKTRGVGDSLEYAILTAEIAKATFGLSPTEHAKVKSLAKQNLRDHMTNLELIFSALGEEATRINVVNDDAQGFTENYEAAIRGGKAAGGALRQFEKLNQTKVVSNKNFLVQIAEASTTDKPLPKPDDE
jgi:hypothetical protein